MVDLAELYGFDVEKYNDWVNSEGPHFSPDHPRYFTTTYLSACVLLRMLKHSMSKQTEIMGICYGRALGNSFYLLDILSFAVEGTATQVDPGDQDMFDMLEYQENAPLVGHRQWNTSWYHSHPGMFPFLSGGDVGTERDCQLSYRVYTAIVIDPITTANTGRMNIGSYCTFPAKKGPDGRDIPDPVVDLPGDVITKYGVHANSYYELDLKYLTTPTDQKVLSDIISKSFGSAIGCSPLREQVEQIGTDVCEVSKTMTKLNTKEERPEDFGFMARKLATTNQARKTGIWLEKMKIAVFG
jgi:COP9 signalosome complex subunit 5